jgi:plastocyanin
LLTGGTGLHPVFASRKPRGMRAGARGEITCSPRPRRESQEWSRSRWNEAHPPSAEAEEEFMHRRRTGLWLGAAALALAVAGAWSCSSKNDNPMVPGGAAKELNSGNLGAGGTYEHRFFTAGTFPYHCNFHSPMTGSVVVSAGATDTVVAVSITSSMSPFPGATVKQGGRVVWTNNTGLTHTVTSN